MVLEKQARITPPKRHYYYEYSGVVKMLTKHLKKWFVCAGTQLDQFLFGEDGVPAQGFLGKIEIGTNVLESIREEDGLHPLFDDNVESSVKIIEFLRDALLSEKEKQEQNISIEVVVL